MPNHAEQLAQELNLSVKNVQGAIELIDQGNTIPFIARYRKEATGSMDDQVLRDLGDRLEYLRGLDKRKEEVTSSITEQGAMTPELTAALTNFVDFCYTIRIITRIFIVFNIINSIFNFYPSKLTQERYEQLWYEASTSASSKLMTHKTLILNAPCSISRTIRQIPPKKHWKHRLRVFWGIYGHQNLHSCVRV